MGDMCFKERDSGGGGGGEGGIPFIKTRPCRILTVSFAHGHHMCDGGAEDGILASSHRKAPPDPKRKSRNENLNHVHE